jgi:RNA polymerase sigma-70 factor (ECF subfamily)
MEVSEARAEPDERAGERFEAFYVREYHGIVRLAYALSGSRLVAEDIAKWGPRAPMGLSLIAAGSRGSGARGPHLDVFLRAYLDWPRIRRPAAWVRKVTVRWAGRAARRRLLEARALARLLAGRAPAVAELPAHDADVWRAVRALPRGQAQVIALRYVVDASVAEIAETLGLAEGTVKAQLHRGRQALAVRLGTGAEMSDESGGVRGTPGGCPDE